MAMRFDTLLEGSPAYGVLDAKDGVLLFRRSGYENEFDQLVTQALTTLRDWCDVIPMTNAEDDCDRLFIAPKEERSFDPKRT